MADIPDKEDTDLLITDWERKQFLAALHNRLFWVGEKIPYFVEMEGKKCKLHDRVWELINKETISDDEKQEIEECIQLLKKKELIDELELETKEMTREEAKT